MDANWFEELTNPTKSQMIERLRSFEEMHWSSGNAHAGAIADMFSSLCPAARAALKEVLYARTEQTTNPNIRRIIELSGEYLEYQMREYPNLAPEDRDAIRGLGKRLRGLRDRVAAYYVVPSPETASHCDGEPISFNDFYWQCRWLLGQMLSVGPLESADQLQAEELRQICVALCFVLRELEDQDQEDAYEESPQAFFDQMKRVLPR
jgi:hypothetical protein